MKKIFSIICLMFCLGAMAQTNQVKTEGYFKSSPTHAATDTITNAVTKNLLVQIDGYQDVITVQPTFTKISGTAAATVKLQGSIDNTNFVDIADASYTVTDVATQTTAFIVSPSSYRYYRLNIVPTGTQSVKVIAPVIVRKKP